MGVKPAQPFYSTDGRRAPPAGAVVAGRLFGPPGFTTSGSFYRIKGSQPGPSLHSLSPGNRERGNFMKIHEYQGKAILRKYGVPVPQGEMASTAGEAEGIAKKLLAGGSGGAVVKAQIHAGGRGKGGGVKIAKSAEEAGEFARKMLGMTLVTHQTGPEGRVVRRLLIEETLPIDRELYLAILVDRAEGKPL